MWKHSAVFVTALATVSFVAPSAHADPAPRPPKPASTYHAAGSLPSARHSSGAARVAAAKSGKTVLMVRVDAQQRFGGLRTFATANKLKVRHAFPSMNTISVEVPPTAADSLRTVLLSEPGVRAVTVAPVFHVADTPNDYATQQAPYLDAVHAPAAWGITHGSAGVRIAVVDTGVDTTHPEFAGKIAGTYNAVDQSSDVSDLNGHGTFVAGVAAAATNNGGIAGAGYDSSILAVRAWDGVSTFPDGSPQMYLDDVVEGIGWAIDHGASVINLSLGSPDLDQTEADVIARAQQAGVVVVAAAGNDNTDVPSFPAALDGVIAVGASCLDGQTVDQECSGGGRALFSNYGPWVDVAAPGVNLYSTAPGGGYQTGSGTSFSSPLVAGEVALLRALVPTANIVYVQDAVELSAHALSGSGLGHGLVDFAAALQRLQPPPKPVLALPAANSVVSRGVALRATTQGNASKVRFVVSGAGFDVTAPVSSGTAATTWTSFGVANGAKTVSAYACNALNQCSAPARVSVTLSNAAPTVTGPRPGQLIGGAFTISAASSGGGVAFYLDGRKIGFDGTSPYSRAVGTSLPDGSHTVKVVQCNAAGTLCAGTVSAPVTFTTKSLHPAITGLTYSLISPNGDGRRDATRATIRLDTAQSVTMYVLNAAGQTVRAARLGVKSGTIAWTWNGRNSAGAYVPNGDYRIRATGTKAVGSAVLRGSAERHVTVDRTAPTMSSITGNGTTFYPYPDSYRDVFTPTTVLAESVTLTLRVKSGTGATVRTLTAARTKGKRGISWNGRNSANHIVPAGTYRWTFTVQDAAGNRRTSPVYSVKVSAKKLVARTFTKQVNGNSAYDYGGSDSCAGGSPTGSDYTYGIWLVNNCDPYYYGVQVAVASYAFTVPAAAVYSRVRLDAYGYAYYRPSPTFTAFDLPKTGTVRFSPVKTVYSTPRWTSWGSVSATGTVTTTHRLHASVVVANNDIGTTDYDVKYVKLTLAYKVLA